MPGAIMTACRPKNQPPHPATPPPAAGPFIITKGLGGPKLITKGYGP